MLTDKKSKITRDVAPENAIPFDFDEYVNNSSFWKVHMRNGEIVKNLKVKSFDYVYVLEGTFSTHGDYVTESWTVKGEFYEGKDTEFDLTSMVSIHDDHYKKSTTPESTTEVYKLKLAPSNFVNVFYYPEENVVKAFRTHRNNYNDALLHQESIVKTSTTPCEFLCSVKIEDHPQVRELLIEKGLIEKIQIPYGKRKE